MQKLPDRFVISSWEERAAFDTLDPFFLGGKATGLLQLPGDWVPPFLVFTKRFRDEWQLTKSAIETLKTIPNEEADLLRILNEKGESEDRRLLVRSNSPSEAGFVSSGAFQSIPASCLVAEIATAIDRIFQQDRDLFSIVQLAIEPALPGHFSNERRVSPRRSIWLVEDLDGRFQQERIEATRSESFSTQLIANSESEVLHALRNVAGYMQSLRNGYFHCEWIWDRRRVWIVQATEAPSPAKETPANVYLQESSQWPFEFSPSWEGLRHFSQLGSGKWRKLQRPLTFIKCGLPTADVFVISGSDWVAGGEEKNRFLRDDLERLCAQYVVVRCDVNDDDYTFLPTSAPSKDPDQLLAFMANVFKTKQVADSDWAFMIARLVPARVSAMVQAFPGAERVRVDALWGFPDGLLHFPHDSYFYTTEDGNVQKTVNYKGICLLFEDQAWVYSSVGRPQDWESTLSSEEVKILAEWGLKLAKELGCQVQLMALARIGGVRGPTGALPWHYTNFDIPPFTHSVRSLPITKDIQSITSYASLKSSFDLNSTVQAYMLRPTPEFCRDAKFLSAAGQFAVQQGKPLYFEGSLLGHSYYVLSNTGAHVVPVIVEPSVDAKQYYKLVRDEIPTIIKRAGGLARLRTLTKQDARVLLARKLLEESYEVWSARTRTEILGELADVIEVVDALSSQYDISSEDLGAARDAKLQSRGGFEKLIYLEETRPGTLDATFRTDRSSSLFSDDDEWVNRPAAPWPSEIRVSELEDDIIPLQLEVSLIPPVKQAVAVDEVATSTKKYNIVAKYGKDKVTIIVSERREAEDGIQLSLFEVRTDESN